MTRNRVSVACLVLVLCVSHVCVCVSAPAPDVTISQGTVVGAAGTSLRGRTYYAYKGIPYAKPPVDERRFKEPEPVEPSDDVIDGTKNGPQCPHMNYLAVPPASGGKEDCLSVNVYTPQVAGDVKLPVMVFIHGGAWLSGAGSSHIAGPKHLLDKDIVLVTFNYRIGALGFLSTGDAAAPGNSGMKDQVAVLKWVRDNIAAFGGDVNSVTIFGQSAGAASVQLHMLSDMSDGLFHRAISESGSALNVWAFPPDPLPMAQQQAAVFGCPQDDTTQLVQCLRQVDAATLVESSHIFYFWTLDPLTIFRPVVEAAWNGLSEEPFLTGDPLELIQQGAFQRKPWMTGVVAQEGILRAMPLIANPKLLAELNANWTTLGPKVFDLWKSIDDPAQVDSMWSNITSFYFSDKLPLDENNLIHFIDLYSDRFFMHGVHKSATLQANNGHDSIYLYNFDYRGIHSYSNNVPHYNRNYGVCHTDDLIYLLPNAAFLGWPEHHPDLKVVNTMVTLWTNFATQGTPTRPGGTNGTVSCDLSSTTTADTCDWSVLDWHPVPSGRSSYLNIAVNNQTLGLDLDMREGFYRQRMDFWDSANLKENN